MTQDYTRSSIRPYSVVVSRAAGASIQDKHIAWLNANIEDLVGWAWDSYPLRINFKNEADAIIFKLKFKL